MTTPKPASACSIPANSGPRAWKLPANIDTDVLAPGIYMKLSLEKIAEHCLESLDPDFARDVRPGDVIVAGPNFGVGSSREQAAGVLKSLGIAAVFAPSFAGLFYRNALNLGLPVYICPQAEDIDDGAIVQVTTDPSILSYQSGSMTAPTSIAFEPLPDFLQSMVDAGGLIAQLRQRLDSSTGAA
ncbi:MAG: 3-isopropylmalate dehydratase [Burkholderiaceae bacterium]